MSEIPPIIDVVDVTLLGRYLVELEFENGDNRVIDLEPYLQGPMFEPIREDYDLFCQVEVDARAGTIIWPNGADLSPRTLYAESKPKVPA
ncbi:MAG: DUF2442 domain-containing protein [Nitriliruptorales bacterium]|nr:DUF2442 domain-containing protein [Nitriliruptorales bacterium]